MKKYFDLALAKSVTVIFLLSALSHGEAQEVTIAPLATRSATQLSVGGSENCHVTTPGSGRESLGLGLALALGTAAIDVGASALQSYFEALAQGYSSGNEAMSASGNFYRAEMTGDDISVNKELDCITIVRGRMGTLDANALPKSLADTDRKRYDPRGLLTGGDPKPKLEILQQYGLADYPDLYIEIQTEFHKTQPLFRLKPTYVYYRKTAAQQRGEGNKDVVLTLTFFKATEAAGTDGMPANSSAAIATVPLRLKAMTVGGEYMPPGLAYDTIWAPIPARPEQAALDELKSQMQRAQVMEIRFSPYNVIATIEETGTPSAFLTFMTNVVKGSRPEATEAFKRALKDTLEGGQAATK